MRKDLRACGADAGVILKSLPRGTAGFRWKRYSEKHRANLQFCAHTGMFEGAVASGTSED